jgi:hypothetical protein
MNRGVPRVLRTAGLAAVALLASNCLSGCLVAGYSSGSGFWVWPGSIVITLVLIVMWLLMRR